MTARPGRWLAAGAIAATIIATSCASGSASTAMTTTTTTTRIAEAGAESYRGLPPGFTHRTPTIGGRARSYYLYVPTRVAARPNRAVPLAVALHGGLGSGAQLANTSQLNAEADRLGFVVAYPEGLLLRTPRGALVRTWDGGGCCAPAMGSGVDDVAFVATVIRRIRQATHIDREHVVVGGHSNGAILSWRMACERAGVLGSAVIVEGSLERPTCTPSRGVDLVQIHGDDDRFLPLAGGRGTQSLSQTDYTSAAESQALWTTAQGCGPATTNAEEHLTITTWADCADGTTTQLIVIAGGTHAWAGADPANSADFLGEPSLYFSATAAFTDALVAD